MEHLSALDAGFLEVEDADPHISMAIGGIAVLTGPAPDFDALIGLIADRTQRTLIGAWAIAPQAGEWIHTAALAIRAQISIDTLLDGVAQFPTYTEAYLAALEQLAI